MTRFFGTCIILAVVSSVYCNLVSDDNGTAAADIDGQKLFELGRQLNKPMLTLTGMAMRNLEIKYHSCDAWAAWSDCGTFRLNYISTKRRRRLCSFKKDNSIDVRNETEINICEGICPKTYNITENGYCIKLYIKAASQAYAEKRCQEDGGYLINIDSEKKYEDVKSILKGASGNVYISGRRENIYSKWEFPYGKQTGFFKWASGEPDSSDKCIFINANTLLWHANPSCTSYSRYLCEIIG